MPFINLLFEMTENQRFKLPESKAFFDKILKPLRNFTLNHMEAECFDVLKKRLVYPDYINENDKDI